MLNFRANVSSSPHPPPVIDRDVLLSEWPVFRRALLHEKENFMSSKKLSKSPTFQQVFNRLLHMVEFSPECSS